MDKFRGRRSALDLVVVLVRAYCVAQGIVNFGHVACLLNFGDELHESFANLKLVFGSALVGKCAG